MQRARACCLQWGAALLLLSLFAGRTLAAVVTSGGVKYTVAEMAQLQLEGGVTDLKATDMKIYWGSLGSWKSGSDILSANTVIEIFLPRFSGSSNLFGAYRSDTTESTVQWLNNPSASVSISEVINKPWAASASVSSQQAATGPGIAGCYGIVQDLSSNAFDLKQIKANAFSMCYWDSQRETLRLYMPTALQITGVYINKVSMYQNYDVNGKQNGLGPLPPIGGIDEKWYQLANVAFYQAEGNSLGCAVSDLTSFPSTPCTSEYLVYQVPFDQYRSVRFGTDHPPMPVQKGAGGVGTVAAPAFVYAAAAGNNDGPSQDVCITVTLISSATIYSVSVNPTSVSLTGLSGSATPSGNIDLYQSKCQCEAGTPNAFVPAKFRSTGTNKVLNQAYFDSAGTMSFELVPGNYIQAGEVVTFTFKLKTGSTTQASQSLKAVLSGQICQNNDLCTSSTSVSAQMSNDVSPSSKIIEVVGNKLRTSIFQSSSDPGSLTHVFVTMTPNFNVDSGSVISLQGLCGTQTNSPKITVMSNRLNGGIPLTDMCSSAGNPTEIDIGDPTLQAVSPKMDWSLGGALKITVSTIMTARNTYVLSWDWQNSNSGNAACPVTVTVSKGSTVVNAESVENMGNTVGYVAAPGFIKYKIGQTTTRPDVTNYICITLRSNYRVSTQSNSAGQNNLAQITLSGLQGSQTVTQPIITACPSFNWDTMTLEAPSNPPTSHFIDVINGGTLHRTTSWSAGTTVLTVNQDDTANNMFYSIPQQQDIKFAIVLKNAVSANPCQTVSLSLSALGPGDNQFTQNVQMVQNSVDRALQDGETDGDVCVLKSYAYGFPTRLISQSTSVVSKSNTITISLRSNMYMDSTSFSPEITISGLTGTNTPGTSLTATAAADQYFPNIEKTTWSSTSGEMVVKLALGSCQLPVKGQATNCMYPGWIYVLQFKQFVNGDNEQSGPTITVQSQFAQNKQASSQAMIGPLRGDHQALYLTRNLFNKYEIGQLNPSPAAMNPICITLRPSIDINVQTTFTLTGMTMFSSGTTVNLYDEYAISALSNGLFQTIGSNPQDNAASYDKSTIQFQLKTGQTLNQDVKYKMCFMMTNNNVGSKTCPAISLSVDSQAAPSNYKGTQTYLCKNDKTRMVYGYPSEPSGCAGYIADRQFIMSSLRSGSNVTSSTVWITAELQPNYELSAGQTITVGPFSSMSSAQSDVSCQVVRNGQFMNSRTNLHSASIVPATTFTTGCKFLSNNIQIYSGSIPTLVYDPYFDVSARRTQGLYKIVVTAGGSGYSNPTVVICDTTPGQEFWTKSSCAGVMSATGSSAQATASLTSQSVTSISLTAAGSGYTLPPKVVITDPTGTGATAQAYLYDYSVYTVQFQLTNQATQASAQAISVVSGNSFVTTEIDSGMKSAKTSMQFGSTVTSDVTFSVTAEQNLYAGDMLFVNLPSYVAVTGPIFGVTSSPNPAFTTFSTQLEWELNYYQEDRARAYISDGWVADGNRHRSGDGDVDGLFVLSPDDDGYNKNKNLCWSRVSCPWGLPDSDITFSSGSRTLSLTKVTNAGTYMLGYTQDVCYKMSSTIPSLSATDYVGMQLKCRNNQYTAATGGSVTSVRVRYGGLTEVTGTSAFAGQTFTVASSGVTSTASGHLLYKVVGVQVVSIAAGTSLVEGDTIVFDATYQVTAATASVTSLYSSSTAVHVTASGLYTGFPSATVSGKAGIALKVLVSVASAHLTSQGSGYTSIPTVTPSSVTTSTSLTQIDLPVFDVSLTNVTSTVVTQTIVDYNPSGSCFVVEEEFPASFVKDCEIKPKEQVGRYTGMTAMIGSNEYIIKQGAGGVYWVTDLKGKKPRSIDLANKPYTIYTQLQLQVAKGKWIRQGESISITIPGYRFKSVPSNQNAYITPSTDDASKTIKERTRFQFAAAVPHSNVQVQGTTTERMLVFGGTLTGTCTVNGKNIEQPQVPGGSAVNNGGTLTSTTASIFSAPTTWASTPPMWGSGYLRPARFHGTCVVPPATTVAQSFDGIFMLKGQRSSVERIEIINPGTSCASGLTVTISDPSVDKIVDATTNTLVCPTDTYLCTRATATVSASGGSVTSVTLTEAGSGYFFPPTVTFTNPSSSQTPCDAVAIVHLSHNYTSRVQVKPDSNLIMYQQQRDQYDSLTGLGTSAYAAVSLFKKYSARKTSSEVASGYVASIVITTVPAPSANPDFTTKCTGALVISAPPSGKTATATLQTTSSSVISSIQVTDGGSGYITPPTVSFPAISACAGAKAQAILGFNTSSVHVSGSHSYSSFTGMQAATLQSTAVAPTFHSSMDSPVIAGFNQACRSATSQTYSRSGTMWGNSRVTGVTVPSSTNVVGFVYGFTSVSITSSPVNANGLVDPMANAMGVPTWSFPSASSVLTNVNNNFVLQYKGKSTDANLADCANAVLIFNAPERSGGQTLQITITSVSNGVPKYTITRQGTGYANIPIVRDILFTTGGYQQNYMAQTANQKSNCKPSFFAFDTASADSTYNIYTKFATAVAGTTEGLTLDGVLMTQEGYGYGASGLSVTATISCSGCSGSKCTNPDGTAITSPCTASALTLSATVSNECQGQCEKTSNPSAFFSPNNRNAMEVCSAQDPANGAYNTRKTLQMRVSSGVSAVASENAYTVKRSKGFQGMKGSLIFKITANEMFASASACEVPKVIVEPPPAGGVQAEIGLEYVDTQVDYYTNAPSSSLTASSKGFTASTLPLQYRIKVINAGSGYVTSPLIRFVSASATTCATRPTIQALVRNGLVASRVELVRKIALTEATSGTTTIQPTCSSSSYIIPTLCSSTTACTTPAGYVALTPLPSCPGTASCAGSLCTQFPCTTFPCSQDNCPTYLSTVGTQAGAVLTDEAFTAIGWNANTDSPVLLNAGFGFSPNTPNPLKLFFPSDAGASYPCAEILVYFTEGSNSETLSPGPLYWPGDLSYSKGALRNSAEQVTKIDYLLRSGFSDGVYGVSTASVAVTTFQGVSARRAAATTKILTVGSTAGFNANDYIKIKSEILLIDSVLTSTTLSVYRGQFNTTTGTYGVGTIVRTFNPGSVLLQDVSSTATTLTLTKATQFSQGTYVLINNEIMFISSVPSTGTSLTVLRGQGGTLPASHKTGAVVGKTALTLQLPLALRAGVTTTQTSINITDTSSLFAGAYITLGNEIMKVTEISGDLVYVTRGELETTPAEHAAGTLFSTTKPSALGTTITRRGMVLVSKVASASDPLIQVKDPVLGSSSSGFQAGDYVQMLGEVMLVQSVVSSTSGYLMQNLTVVRGQQSTTAEATADAGTPVTYVFNPKTLTKTIAANTAITSSDLSDMNGIAAGDYLLMTSGTQNEVIKYLGGSSFARGQANTTEGEFPQTGTVIQKVDKMPTLVKFINDTVSTAVNQTTELTDITLKQFEGISAGATVVIDAQVFNVTSIDAANSKLNLVSMYPQTQSVSTTNRLVIPAGTKVYVVQDARLLSQDMAAHDTVVNLYGDVSSTYSAGDFVRVDTYQGTSEILQVTGVSGSSLTVVRGNPTLTHTKNESVLYMYNKVGVFDVSTFVAGDYIKVGQELDQVQAVGTHELTINRISPYNTWSFHEGSDLVTLQQKTSFQKTTLAVAVNSSLTSVILTDASGFKLNDYIQVSNEQLQVVNINGNNLQVSRAQLGTTASAHSAGATVKWVSSPTVSSTIQATSFARRSMHLRYVAQSSSITLPAGITRNVWAELDQEIFFVPGAGDVAAANRGRRGTTAAAHTKNVPYNFPNNLFSLQFNVKSAYPGATGFSAVPVYGMSAGGVYTVSGFSVRNMGSGVTTDPTLQLTLNRYVENGDGSNLPGVTGTSYSYQTFTNQVFLSVDMTNKFTQRLIRPSLLYPEIYKPSQFPADPLYFQDLMDGFDTASGSSLLSSTSSAINASSANVYEPGSPVWVLDSFGQMLGDQPVQQQVYTLSSPYAYSISNKPSVLDSTWTAPSLMIVSTSSATSASLFLNDTLIGKFANGQTRAGLSSSTRMFVWKTDPRKLAVSIASSSPSGGATTTTTTTPGSSTNVGAIVGGVIGGVVGAALLGFLAYKFLAPAAVAKPPVEEMVPVYLPQTYPVLPVDYASAAPMPVQTPVYGQQPMAYGM